MSCPAAPQKSGSIQILGLNLHPVSVDEVHEFIEGVIRNGQKARVLHLNIHGVTLALRQDWLKHFFNEAELVFCDGDGVRWGARLLGLAIPPKITYDRWIWRLADFSARKHYRLFFLGARPGAAEEAARRLKSQNPQLDIVGTHHGYFPQEGEENELVIALINRLAPDILMVGLGMPIQEEWLRRNWQRLNVHVFLTGGAVFDYASGRSKRAPEWVIRAEMEWLFRFLREPQRLFARYAFDIPYFFLQVFRE